MVGTRGCPICAAGAPPDVLVEADASWVTARPAACLPGYVCVVSRVHVEEPFELDGLQRRRYFQEMLDVARALKEHTRAEKINYEIHGNTIPHLQTHIYPRFAGDPFAGTPVDGASRRFERTREDLVGLAAAARRGLETSASAPRSSSDAASTAYDEMAEWFADHSATSFYNAQYDRPAVLQLVGDVAGQHLLDVGCGAGHYLNALRERVATVVGIDASAKLLQEARRRTDSSVELIRHDLNEPLAMLADASFDGAQLVKLTNVYLSLEEYSVLEALPAGELRKTRWQVVADGRPMAIDQIHGRLEGLVLAEVELDAAEDHRPRPSFAVDDVTNDDRFSGGALAFATDDAIAVLLTEIRAAAGRVGPGTDDVRR